jgi:predicted PurR-regulated permease PerM
MAWLARATLVVVGITALVWLTWQLSHILLLLFGACVVCAILRSIADFIKKHTPLGPKWSLAISGLLIALVIAGFLVLLGAQIGGQFSNVAQQVTATINDLSERFGVDIMGRFREAAQIGWLSRLAGYAPDLLGAIASLVLVIVGGIFLAVDPKLYREGLLHLLPEGRREQVRDALGNASDALRMWLLGKIIAMVVIGVVTSIGLYVLGVPSALALGFIAGLLEFVPFIGPILSFIPAALVSLSAGGSTIWWVLGFYIALQQLENNLLVPLIQQRTVELPPVLGLFAVVAIGAMFGPVGVILGVPLTIVLMVLVKQLYVRNTLGDPVELPTEKRAVATDPPYAV